jgi:hypothetical protein
MRAMARGEVCLDARKAACFSTSAQQASGFDRRLHAVRDLFLPRMPEEATLAGPGIIDTYNQENVDYIRMQRVRSWKIFIMTGPI